MKQELIKIELNVINNKIGIMRVGNIDYISITDLARYKDKDRTDYIIQNWMRTTNSLLFLGTWEYLNNENFRDMLTQAWVELGKEPTKINEISSNCLLYTSPSPRD